MLAPSGRSTDGGDKATHTFTFRRLRRSKTGEVNGMRNAGRQRVALAVALGAMAKAHGKARFELAAGEVPVVSRSRA
jgi:hypothetical protein